MIRTSLLLGCMTVLLSSCAGGDFSEPLGAFSKAVTSSQTAYASLQQQELEAYTEALVNDVVERKPDIWTSAGCERLYDIGRELNGASDPEKINWRAVDTAIADPAHPCGLVDTSAPQARTFGAKETHLKEELFTAQEPANADECLDLAKRLAGPIAAPADNGAKPAEVAIEEQRRLTSFSPSLEDETSTPLLTSDLRKKGAEIEPLYKALADYATSLAEAAKAEDIAKLNAAIAKMGSSVGNFIAVAAAVPTAGLAKPAFDFFIGALNWVVTNYAKHKRFEAIKETVAKAEICMPSYADALGRTTVTLRVSLLLTSIYNLEGRILNDYEAIRQDPAKDFSRFDRQRALVTELIRRGLLVHALQSAKTALSVDGLVSAHSKLNEALQKDEPSLEEMLAALQGFLGQVEAFQALLKTFENQPKS